MKDRIKKTMDGNGKEERCLLALLLLMAAGSIGYVICTQTFWFYDIERYWQNMNAFLAGRFEEVKLVMPWARITGQLLCPGFLPQSAAIAYFYLLLLAGTIYLGILIYGYLKEKEIFRSSAGRCIAAAVVTMLPFYWHDALNTGNIGGPICIFLMIAAFLTDRNPYLAAVLLSFGMMKPQNAGIFLVILFFRKNYRTVFTTAGICAGGWGLSALYERILQRGVTISAQAHDSQGVWEIIERFADMGVTNEKYSFFCYGIFDPLVDAGVPVLAVLALSALSGILLAFLICRLLRNYPVLQQDAVIYFAAAGVLSVIWCYKSPCDEIIMIITSVAVLYYWGLSDKTWKSVVLVIALLAAFNDKIFRFWGAHLISMTHDAAVFGDQLLRLAALGLLLLLIVRKYPGSGQKKPVENEIKE